MGRVPLAGYLLPGRRSPHPRPVDDRYSDRRTAPAPPPRLLRSPIRMRAPARPAFPADLSQFHAVLLSAAPVPQEAEGIHMGRYRKI